MQHGSEVRDVHRSDGDLHVGTSSLGLPFSPEATVSNLLSRLANLEAFPPWKPIWLWRQVHTPGWQALLDPQLPSSRAGEGEAADPRGHVSSYLTQWLGLQATHREFFVWFSWLTSYSLRNKDMTENQLRFVNLSTIQSNGVF